MSSRESGTSIASPPSMTQTESTGLLPATARILNDARGAFQRVFVPIDYSSDCHHALGVALELQRSYGAAVCLFHVVHGDGSDDFLGGLGVRTDNWVAEAERRLSRFLRHVAPGAEGGIELRARIGGEGERVQMFLDEATEWRATLLVLTATIHSSLFRSVAERVVRKSDIAVLALPSSPDP
jgi:nucleotide-binding universal stress UspA family protein